MRRPRYRPMRSRRAMERRLSFLLFLAAMMAVAVVPIGVVQLNAWQARHREANQTKNRSNYTSRLYHVAPASMESAERSSMESAERYCQRARPSTAAA